MNIKQTIDNIVKLAKTTVDPSTPPREQLISSIELDRLMKSILRRKIKPSE